VLPAQWRGVGEQLGRHHLPGRTQMRDGVRQVGRIPVDDSGDDKVQARGAELLRLCASLRDASLPECADHLGQRMSLLALVQAGMAAPKAYPGVPGAPGMTTTSRPAAGAITATYRPTWDTWGSLQRRRRSGLSSQSSMNSVRSIRPSSCSAKSSWFWRRYAASFFSMTDGATTPACSDATKRTTSSQCWRMMSVLIRRPKIGCNRSP